MHRVFDIISLLLYFKDTKVSKVFVFPLSLPFNILRTNGTASLVDQCHQKYKRNVTFQGIIKIRFVSCSECNIDKNERKTDEHDEQS